MASANQKQANLNKSGLFFEEKCADLLRQHDSVSAFKSEYPYSHLSELNGESVDGSADFIALTVPAGANCQVLYVIECKKVDTDTKNWVFHKATEDRYRTDYDSPYYLPRLRSEDSKLHKEVQRVERNSFAFNVTAPDIVNKGYELREKDGSLNRNSGLKIYSAVSQANKAVSALISQGRTAMAVFRPSQQAHHMITYVIPVVVTNSIIEIVEYDLKDISISDGTLDDEKASFREAQWVWYEASLGSSDIVSFINAKDGIKVTPYRRLVPVVNVNSLHIFIDQMDGIISHYEDWG